MSTVNLYDVLNISSDCETKEIKDAYRILAKEFHPVKPTGDAEMFELVTQAYNVLVNPTTRKEYDELYKLSKSLDTSHYDLKTQSKNFFDAVSNDVTKKQNVPKEEQDNEFKKAFGELDKKHGYVRDDDNETELSAKDTQRKYADLQAAREQDDIESMCEKLFSDDKPVDMDTFNAAFDFMHKGHNELIPHTGIPDAWNSILESGSTYSSIDSYDKIYADDDSIGIGNTLYGSVKIDPSKKKKITKNDLNNFFEKSFSTLIKSQIYDT